MSLLFRIAWSSPATAGGSGFRISREKRRRSLSPSHELIVVAMVRIAQHCHRHFLFLRPKRIDFLLHLASLFITLAHGWIVFEILIDLRVDPILRLLRG